MDEWLWHGILGSNTLLGQTFPIDSRKLSAARLSTFRDQDCSFIEIVSHKMSFDVISQLYSAPNHCKTRSLANTKVSPLLA